MASTQQLKLFRTVIWEYYRARGRHDLPWRLPKADGSFDPYTIMVSEAMLQQTQVSRVVPKFAEFLQLFPTVQVLAAAPLAQVLIAWSGLGYNRRAKFLWQAAQTVVNDYGGEMPCDEILLQKLPGIGKNTAGAIGAYALNAPSVFVETNVRTVFIHHFFADIPAVPDAAIIDLVHQTLDHERPREWYWALMDYGTHLKQTVGNLSRSSKSYAKQSKFAGSLRQIRGAVIRLLTQEPQTGAQLNEQIADDRLPAVLADLLKENLIQMDHERYRLPGA